MHANTLTLAIGWQKLISILKTDGYTGRAAFAQTFIFNPAANTAPIIYRITADGMNPPAGTTGVTVAPGASVNIDAPSHREFVDGELFWIYSSVAQNVDVRVIADN